MTRALRADSPVGNKTMPDLLKEPFEFYEGGTITASFTLTRAHLGRMLVCESASPIVITIPANTATIAFIEGEGFMAIMNGAGQLSIAGSGATVNSPSGLNASAQYAIIGAVRMPTANVWTACGNLTA